MVSRSRPPAARPFVPPQPRRGCCRGHTGCRTRCWSSNPTTPSWSGQRGARAHPWTLTPLLRTGPLQSRSPRWTEIALWTQSRAQSPLWHARSPHWTRMPLSRCQQHQRHTRCRGGHQPPSPAGTRTQRDSGPGPARPSARWWSQWWSQWWSRSRCRCRMRCWCRQSQELCVTCSSNTRTCSAASPKCPCCHWREGTSQGSG